MDSYEQIDDQTLLKRYAEHGDRDALGALFRRHVDHAYSTAYRLCRNRADAEDAVQNAFVQIIQKAADFRGGSEFGVRAWMMRIVCGVCLNRIKSDARRRLREEKATDDAAETTAPPIPDNEPDPGTLTKPVIDALNALPDRHRAAIWLHHYQGMTLKETAATLEVPEKTADMWVYRGMNDLRNRLAATGVLAGSTSVLAALCMTPVDRAPESLVAAIPKLLSRIAEFGGGTILTPVATVESKTVGWIIAAAASLLLITGGALVMNWSMPPVPPPPAATPPKTDVKKPDAPKPLAAYSMKNGKGTVILDTSGIEEPINFTIGNPANAQWTADCLKITGPAGIRARGEMQKLRKAWKENKGITIETWICPSRKDLVESVTYQFMCLQLGRRTLTAAATKRDSDPDEPAQFVIVMEDKPDGGTLTFFQSGRRNGSVQGKAPVALDASPGPIEITFASNLILDGGKTRPSWRGELFAIRIYGRVLTPEELSACVPPSIETGTVPDRQ